MTISFNTRTPGFENRPAPEKPATNLMSQAIELAKDGELSDADLTKLDETAASNGENAASEALLIQSLREDPQAFATAVKDAVKKQKKGFDPNDFTWAVSETLRVKGSNGESISMNFKPGKLDGQSASGASEAEGAGGPSDFGKAARDELRMDFLRTPDGKIDDAAIKAWSRLDKYDLGAVKAFIAERGFTPEKEAQFIQSYLEGYYAHTGAGAAWGGASDIQAQLPKLPVDGGKRKFIDCEAYTAITARLCDNAKPYVVDGNGDSGGLRRNHQVSVVRIGDQGFVQSNGKLQHVGPSSQSDDAMIAAYTGADGSHSLSRPAADTTGPLHTGNEAFDIGETLTLPDDKGMPQQVRISAKQGDYGLEAVNLDDERFAIAIDPATGAISMTRLPSAP